MHTIMIMLQCLFLWVTWKAKNRRDTHASDLLASPLEELGGSCASSRLLLGGVAGCRLMPSHTHAAYTPTGLHLLVLHPATRECGTVGTESDAKHVQ